MNDIYSFYKLISEYKVEIPVIQRDYAQGRTESKATDVRKSIVKSIINTVNGGTRLFFDFVYGRIEGDTFIPFDGQQRLTTLFLFHRYIFEKCKYGKACQYCDNCQCVSLLSRFSYTTRQSSREFCEQLICNPILPQSSDVSMSDYIKDQPWFYPEWEKDPTIVGMLTMLDEIDKQCKELPQLNYTEVAQKLTSGCVCPITFHFVNMGEHKMPDSTYIKMNARGKALSSFENFKASLEEYLTANKKDDIKKRLVGEYVDNKQTGVDGIWLDLFYNVTKPNVPDLTMLSFFKRHFLNYYVINGSSDPTTISRLESQLTEDDFVPFEVFEAVLKDKEYEVLNSLFNLLDTLSTNYDDVMKGSLPIWCRDEYQYSGTHNYWNLFIGNWNKKGQRSEDNEGEGSERYQSRVAFYAVVKYFDTAAGFDSAEFSQWMRVVWNYIENVQYNNFDDYKKDLLLINSLSSGLHQNQTNETFYSWLSRQSGSTLSYRQNQLDEEFTKARLFAINAAVWKDRILNLEKHKYFTGEIKFMFDFLSNNPSASEFDSYSIIMKELFDDNGLNSAYDSNGNFVFRRALMYYSSSYSYSYGYNKGRNWSFLKNKDRDISWKRFISDSDIVSTGIAHNSILKSLIEGINTQTAQRKSIKEAFDYILSNSANILDWRRLFVESKDVWSYMSDNRYIRYDSDNEIYLLQTTRMSGTHAELRTYYLYDKMNDTNSWKKRYYSVSGREENPCLYFEKQLNGQTYVIDICWDIKNGNGYYLNLFTRDESQVSTLITPIVAGNAAWGLTLCDPSNPNSRYKSNDMPEKDILALAYNIMKAI